MSVERPSTKSAARSGVRVASGMRPQYSRVPPANLMARDGRPVPDRGRAAAGRGLRRLLRRAARRRGRRRREPALVAQAFLRLQVDQDVRAADAPPDLALQLVRELVRALQRGARPELDVHVDVPPRPCAARAQLVEPDDLLRAELLD